MKIAPNVSIPDVAYTSRDRHGADTSDNVGILDHLRAVIVCENKYEGEEHHAEVCVKSDMRYAEF